MSIVMTFELPYPSSSGNHSVKHGGGRHYLTDEARDYRRSVANLINPRGDRVPLRGPLRTDWVFAPPNARERDEDNVLKVVKDALSLAGLWVSDGNKTIRSGDWVWTDPVPGGAILLTITQEGS